MSMGPPHLPWELIERVVDLSRGRPHTLCSFSLTCRQLCSRSRLLMLARVQLENADRVFAFVAFLLANPELKASVHTIIVTPADFVPSLLCILPDLSSIECADESRFEELEDEGRRELDTRVRSAHRSLAVHHTSLACFKRLGARIHTLRLDSVSFPTSLAFAQVLLAFANITHLVCLSVIIETAGGGSPLEIVRRRLLEQMRLKTLIVSVHPLWSVRLLKLNPFPQIDPVSLSRGVDGPGTCPGDLLFDPRLVPSTVESLRLIDGMATCRQIISSRISSIPFIEGSQFGLRAHHQLDWCRLQSLELQMTESEGVVVDRTVELLEVFPNSAPKLRKITIEWQLSSANSLVGSLSSIDESGSDRHVFNRLRHALLRFPQADVTLKCTLEDPLHANSLSFWARELEKYLPHSTSSSVTMVCDEGEY